MKYIQNKGWKGADYHQHLSFINSNYYLMQTGKVKFFNESKGYGFIKDDDSDQEYFVHVSGLVDEIKQNDSVTFELKEGKKGLNAINVKIA